MRCAIHRFGFVKKALALAVFIAAGAAGPVVGRELNGMSGDEIKVLEQRLADASCYRGAIDGNISKPLTAAKAACPDQEPRLTIETGMHTASIERISVDAQCHLLATGSDDKTVRLWSLPTGRLLHTQRLPAGDANSGKIYAVALTPDGQTIAAGGWDAHYDIDKRNGIYVFDAASGGNLRRIGAFSNVVQHLVFSADGTKLAAGLGGKNGVRVYETATMRELMADEDYGDSADGLAFAADGTLYATSYDGFIRRYSRDLKRTAKVKAVGDKRPFAIAVNPVSGLLGIGFADSTKVDIIDPNDLHRIAAADTSVVNNGSLSRVTWSSDGKYLYAGGRYSAKFGNDWHFPLLKFLPNGQRTGPLIATAENALYSLQPCGDAIAFGASDPSFGFVKSDGSATTLGLSRAVDMRSKKADDFSVSPDGTRLRFGLGIGGVKPVVFDLLGASLEDAPKSIAGLVAPKLEGLPIKDFVDSLTPKFGTTTIKLQEYESSRAVAIRPDNAGFVMGADYSLRSFDGTGKERWSIDITGLAWGVNLARDGELVLVAYGDGTVRWHRWSDGKELLALFVDRSDRRWVAWTPTGYYAASPGGEDLIGWHMNRGWEQTADFFPAARFHDRFNRPDIVQLVLETLNESEAVKKANIGSKRKEDSRSISAALPPIVNILSPIGDSPFSGTTIDVTYSTRSPSGLPIDKVEVLVDGRPVTARGLGPQQTSTDRRSLTIPVPAKDVEISLIARSGTLVGEPGRVRLTYAGAATGQPGDNLKPTLYALVIGISKYSNPDLRLEYAAKDASDFAAAAMSQKGGLYGNVVVKTLLDAEVSRGSVVEALEWMEKQVTARDFGMVFAAGHGTTDLQQNYWFLPADADITRLRATAVSQDDILRTMRSLSGKALLFLDTCHSNQAVGAGTAKTRGAVDMNIILSELRKTENGVVTFASSTGRELSMESPEWKNGAFTKAIIEGLFKGEADPYHTGTVTVSQLDAFVTNRVKKLTDGGQHPVMSRPTGMQDYPIALVK